MVPAHANSAILSGYTLLNNSVTCAKLCRKCATHRDISLQYPLYTMRCGPADMNLIAKKAFEIRSVKPQQQMVWEWYAFWPLWLPTTPKQQLKFYLAGSGFTSSNIFLFWLLLVSIWTRLTFIINICKTLRVPGYHCILMCVTVLALGRQMELHASTPRGINIP